MPAFSQRDITLLFVGKTPVAKTTGAISTLNDGEIGLFTPSGTRLTEANAATATEFIIVQGRGSAPAVHSGTIVKADLVAAACKRKVYVAPVEQVDYIGFNGTSGAIEVIDDNLYYIRLNLDQSRTSNHGGQYIKYGAYRSPLTGTTQGTVAYSLVNSIIGNFSRERDQLIKAERVHNNAGSATTAATGTLTAALGSKYVAATGATITTDFQVGSLVRFGTAVTDPVYKIVTVTDNGATGELELDVPYQGTSGTFAAGAAEFITPALEAAGDYGIKLTGVEQTWSLPGLHYKKTIWKTLIDDFGTTTVTNSVAGNPGNGTYEQMAELEWFTQGNEGDPYRNSLPGVITPRAVVSDQGYDQINLRVVSKDFYPVGHTSAYKEYHLVIPNTTPAFADGGTADDITDVLEVLVFGTANGNFAI